LAQGDPEDNALEDGGQGEDPIGPGWVFQGGGVEQVKDAFIGGDTAADIEAAIVRLEQAIRQAHPQVRQIFIEAASLAPRRKAL
jgi:hypothetical protein